MILVPPLPLCNFILAATMPVLSFPFVHPKLEGLGLDSNATEVQLVAAGGRHRKHTGVYGGM
ncbi:MAG: hypothetical protein M1568_00675 [Acidobacteria bacterium]|jgi:hypothetical protein|nr:hypothetical protein [Acidobacteriota bacterium]